MPINSRAKGARGERELAEVLQSYGHKARRGQQFKGGVDSPDVVCETLPQYHFECKLVEAGNPYVWLDQAIRDAGHKIPIVVHRRKRRQWIAILNLDDLMLYLIGVRNGQQLPGCETLASKEPGTLELNCPGVSRPQSKRQQRTKKGTQT